MKIDRESSKKNKKAIKLAPILLAMVMVSSCLHLTGCSVELAPDNSDLDMLMTNSSDIDANSLNNGIQQIKDVEGENFQLVINYSIAEKEWHINTTKDLFVSIKTQILPDDLEVYIDNIHMDTSIISTKAGYSGIKQDSMDDRIHNSLMLGFPISNTKSYFGTNTIEGEDSEFIEGYSYGYNYYHGEVSQKRRLESDFLEEGVYANKIDSVIDLIIVDKETGKALRQVSVKSELGVEINNIVSFEEKKDDQVEKVTYKYNKDGSREEISREPVNQKTKSLK